MDIVKIPLEDINPRFQIKTQISKKRFSLELSWNDREKIWSLHVADDKPLANGIALVPNWPLFQFYLGERKWLLILLADKEPISEPTFTNLQTDFSLVCCEAL